MLSGAYHGDVGSSGQHAAEVLHHNPHVLDSTNQWLERLHVPYKVNIRRTGLQAEGAGTAGDIVSLVLFDHRSQTVVSPSDVGFGVSQLLPIVVQACLPGPGVLIVEQPEIHLHPRLQAEMGDLIIEASRAHGKQLSPIVETHSEHLMLRLQRRIRDGDLDPADVSVLYVDVPPGSTAAQVTPIRLERGHFRDERPSGFFDERLTEVLG